MFLLMCMGGGCPRRLEVRLELGLQRALSLHAGAWEPNPGLLVLSAAELSTLAP